MRAPQFIPATLGDHRAALLELNVEYLSWVFAQVDTFFGVSCAAEIGMEAPDYAAATLDKLCDLAPPGGRFYLIEHRGEFAGMGGLRGLNASVAEIKRIYVRPRFRGARLGEHLLDHLLADAREFGFPSICLESAPFMRAAHRIYEAAGFVDRAPYGEAEVPAAFQTRWRFMERSLAKCG